MEKTRSDSSRANVLKVENESLRREAQQKRQVCQDLEQDLRRARQDLEQAQQDLKRTRRENETLRVKNDSNLQQTQQGIKTFKVNDFFMQYLIIYSSPNA